MLHYALIFLIIAIVAALFGFGWIQGVAIQIAVILVAIALVVWIVSMIKRA